MTPPASTIGRLPGEQLADMLALIQGRAAVQCWRPLLLLQHANTQASTVTSPFLLKMLNAGWNSTIGVMSAIAALHGRALATIICTQKSPSTWRQLLLHLFAAYGIGSGDGGDANSDCLPQWQHQLLLTSQSTVICPRRKGEIVTEEQV